MKHIWKTALALTLAILMLAGCAGKPSDSDTTNATGGEVSGKDDIVIAVGGDIFSLNPHKQNDIASGYVVRGIYNTLIRVNENNEFVGDLVEDNWEYLDTKTCKMQLKEGITFSDGTPMTSEDVKFSIEHQKSCAKTGHLVEFISDVEVVDERTFIIHMDRETNILLSSLAHMCSGILCKSYCEKLEAEGKSVDDYPMGSGPYIFDEWVTGTSVTMHKNPNYFDADRAAQNNSITMKVIPEEAARTIALETGEVDMVIGLSSADANRVRENSKLKLHEYENTSIEFLCFNTSKAPFDNVDLRKAISHAIKKDDVLIGAINGEGTVRDTYFAPVAIGYYGTETKYEYDLDKAKEYLTKAGYPDGLDFTLTLSGPARNRAATVIKENLSKIGVNVNINMVESSAFYEEMANEEYDACLTGWVPNAEADNTYRPLFMGTHGGDGNNYSVYKNPEVDRLIEEAAASLDQAVVDADRGKVLEIVSNDAIWVPLYSSTGMIAAQAGLQGVHCSPIQYHEFMFLHY